MHHSVLPAEFISNFPLSPDLPIYSKWWRLQFPNLELIRVFMVFQYSLCYGYEEEQEPFVLAQIYHVSFEARVSFFPLFLLNQLITFTFFLFLLYICVLNFFGRCLKSMWRTNSCKPFSTRRLLVCINKVLKFFALGQPLMIRSFL